MNVHTIRVIETAILMVCLVSLPVEANQIDLVESGQALGDCRSFGVALGDLDGDRDLDVDSGRDSGIGKETAVWHV